MKKRMDLEQLRTYCAAKKGVSEDFPFDEKHLVIKVGSKLFAITDVTAELLRVNLKCDPVLADELRQLHPEIVPGYHMNKRHWNTVDFEGDVPAERLLWLVDHSYELVFKGLKKAERMQIEAGESEESC